MRSRRTDPTVLAPRRSRSRAARAGAALGGTVLLTTGVAVASWSASGTGQAYARSKGAQPLRTVAVEPAADLHPGGTGALAVTVENRNAYDVVLTDVLPDGPATSGVPACDDAGNGVAMAARSGSWTIPKGSSLRIDLPDAVSMAESSPDACQDRTFAIPVRLVGAQARTAPQPPPPASMEVSASALDFGGTTPWLQRSTAQRVVVRNAGGQPLTGISHAFTGSFAFAYAATTCPAELAPGASCAYDVTFTPSFPFTERFPATLTVAGAGRSVPVSLSGTGTGPYLLAAGSTAVDLGTVPVGSTRTFDVGLRNGGDAEAPAPSAGTVNVGSTTPAGTFTKVGTTCTAPLAPGGTCAYTIRYAPTTTGEHRGGLQLPPSPATVFVQLRGVGG